MVRGFAPNCLQLWFPDPSPGSSCPRPECNLNQSAPSRSFGDADTRVYWRVEGSLLELTTVRPIAFFTWNSQTFLERWVRRGLVFLMAVLRPFLYALNRVFATRVVYSVLRRVSRDRLDLLGDEYFQYELKPRLKPEGIRQLQALAESGKELVLVSQGLDHVMRPLARYLGVNWLVANRLEFRDGMATGRLLDPIVRPRGVFARIIGGGPDGTRTAEQLVRDLGWQSIQVLESAVVPAVREVAAPRRVIVHFGGAHRQGRFRCARRWRGRKFC